MDNVLAQNGNSAGFQSPSGDSLFSDRCQGTSQQKVLEMCFNPLAGIRCFLTGGRAALSCLAKKNCFNPLAGIRCFLTK